ncbi:MAG: hypothetical protein IIU08_04750, partial [Clostridia bacterium]|nr:hypothetical protein [Clostridia bacterium]
SEELALFHRIGGCAVRDFRFLYGSASLGWKGRASPYRKPVLHPRAHAQIQIHVQTEPEKTKTVRAELPSSSPAVLFHVKQWAKKP